MVTPYFPVISASVLNIKSGSQVIVIQGKAQDNIIMVKGKTKSQIVDKYCVWLRHTSL